jgi:hypothetical protein
MSRLTLWLGLAWVAVAVPLAIATTVGGDTSIVMGFLWLGWTAPIGLIWQFWVYDHVLPLFGATTTNWLGLAFVLVGAYLFWFVAIPKISRAARRHTGPP